MELDSKSIKTFVLILVVVLIGFAFATSIVDTNYEASHTFTRVNETLSIATARTGITQPNISQMVVLSLTYPKLSSVTVIMYNYTDGATINAGNYTVNATGLSSGYTTYSLYLINNTYWGSGKYNNTLISYSYYPENYVLYSNARTILDLVGLFVALMILLVVIDYVLEGKLSELIRG